MGPGRALFSKHGKGFTVFRPRLFFVHGRNVDKLGPMNPEQLQSLAVLALAMVPVAVLWWVWIRMLG
jgi:hypothetical protein